MLQVYSGSRHLMDLRFVAVRVRSSGFPTGQQFSYSNNPLAGVTSHKFVSKRTSASCTVVARAKSLTGVKMRGIVWIEE